MDTWADINPSPRESVLEAARDAITGDRNNQYGPPTQDFERTAAALNALGFRAPVFGKSPGYGPIKPHHVAIIIAAVKLSRLMWSPHKADSWVDLAGYAGCGYECVMEEGNTDNAAHSAEVEFD